MSSKSAGAELPQDVAGYIKRMENAVKIAKDALSALKSENDALRVENGELNKVNKRLLGELEQQRKPTAKRRRQTDTSSGGLPNAWTGNDSFFKTEKADSRLHSEAEGSRNISNSERKPVIQQISKRMPKMPKGHLDISARDEDMTLITIPGKPLEDSDLFGSDSDSSDDCSRNAFGGSPGTQEQETQEQGTQLIGGASKKPIECSTAQSTSSEVVQLSEESCSEDQSIDSSSDADDELLEGLEPSSEMAKKNRSSSTRNGQSRKNEKQGKRSQSLLTREDRKLKSGILVPLILSKLNESNVSEVALELLSIHQDYVSTGLLNFLQERVQAVLPSHWLHEAPDETEGLSITYLFSESLLSALNLLVTLIRIMAKIKPSCPKRSLALLDRAKQRMFAFIRERRLGFSLHWINIAADAKKTVPKEQLEKMKTGNDFITGDADGSSSSSNVECVTVPSSGGDCVVETEVQSHVLFAKELGTEDDDEESVDDNVNLITSGDAKADCIKEADDGAEQSCSRGPTSTPPTFSLGSLKRDASFALYFLFFSKCCLQLGAIDFLYDSILDLTATIAPSANAGEVIAVLLAIQSGGLDAFGSYRQEISRLLSALTFTVNSEDRPHPLHKLVMNEIESLKARFNDCDCICSRNGSASLIDLVIEELYEVCQETRLAHVDAAYRFPRLDSCIDAVTVEARRFGVLHGITAANRVFMSLSNNSRSNRDAYRSLYSITGLTDFESYVEKIVSISSQHVAVMSASIDPDEWVQTGSLFCLLSNNPFTTELGDKFHEFSDEHDIRLTVRSHFQAHWSLQLAQSMDPILIQISFSVQYSILSALLIDYTGPQGQSLNERLTARIQQARRDMAAVGSEMYGTSLPYIHNKSEGSSMWFLHLAPLTSIPSSDTIIMAAKVFDTFMQSLIPTGLEGKGGNFLARRAWQKLSFTIHEVLSLVITNILERLLFLTESSIHGLIDAIVISTETSGSVAATCDTGRREPGPSDSSLVLHEILRFLKLSPAPWMHRAHADSFVEYLKLSRIFKTLSLPLPLELALIIRQLSKKAPVFVINLKRRTDRWQKILQICDTHRLAAIRVPAVEGAEMTVTDNKLKRNKDYNSSVLTSWDSTLNSKFDERCAVNRQTILTPTERACAMSHISVWRIIAGKEASSVGAYLDWYRTGGGVFLSLPSGDGKFPGEEWFLIFEDDACVREAALGEGSFFDTVKNFVHSLPENVDILYLGHVIPKNASKHGNKTFLKPSYLWQLHAYLITKRTANILLHYLPVDCPVDNFLARLIYEGIVRVYAVREVLVKQRNSRSINKKRDSDIEHSGKM